MEFTPKMKLTVTLLLIGLIGTIAAFYVLNIKVKFSLHDELNLLLSPLDAVLEVANNENPKVTFSLTNNNFAECSTSCQYTITDLGEMQVLTNESFGMEHNDVRKIEFELQKKGKGLSERWFLLAVSCHNKPSLLCNTDGRTREVTALAVVKDTLQSAEVKVVDDLRPSLSLFIEVVNNVSMIRKEYAQLAKVIGIDIDDLLLRKALLLEEKAIAIEKLWSDNEFLSLNEQFTDADLIEGGGVYNALVEERDTLLRLIAQHQANKIALEDLYTKARAFTLSINETPVSSDVIVSLSQFNKDLDDAALIANEGASKANLVAESITELNVSYHALLEAKAADEKRAQFLLLFTDTQVATIRGASVASRTLSCVAMNESLRDVDAINVLARLYRQENYANRTDARFFDEIEATRSAITLEAQAAAGANWSTAPEDMEFELSYGERLQLVEVDASLLKSYALDSCGPHNVTRLKQNPSLIGVYSVEQVGNYSLISSLKDPVSQCCYDGVCGVCCTTCGPTPILFIHGHSFNEQNTPDYSMSAFTKIQDRLTEYGYINAGELDVTPEVATGIWGHMNLPVAVRASYYYIKHYSLGGRTVTTQKSERIENYALRLKEIIDVLKGKTGAKKVIIVAHSMGGLVARNYLSLFGEESVEKVIFINTPHHGVSARVEQLCAIIGASKECEDLSAGSVFLSRLNAAPLPSIPLINIRSTGCPMGEVLGDGIVTESSALLDGAQNYVIEGNCTDQFVTDLHTNALDPDLHPEVFELLTEFLRSD